MSHFCICGNSLGVIPILRFVVWENATILMNLALCRKKSFFCTTKRKLAALHSYALALCMKRRQILAPCMNSYKELEFIIRDLFQRFVVRFAHCKTQYFVPDNSYNIIY